MSGKRTEHVIMDGKRNSFRCLRCGTEYKPVMPVPVPMFVAMGREFVKLHRHCRERSKTRAA